MVYHWNHVVCTFLAGFHWTLDLWNSFIFLLVAIFYSFNYIIVFHLCICFLVGGLFPVHDHYEESFCYYSHTGLWCAQLPVSFGYISKSETGQVMNIWLASGWTTWQFYQQWVRVLVFYASEAWWYPIVDLLSIFMMTNDFGHIFIFLMAICIISSIK